MRECWRARVIITIRGRMARVSNMLQKAPRALAFISFTREPLFTHAAFFLSVANAPSGSSDHRRTFAHVHARPRGYFTHLSKGRDGDWGWSALSKWRRGSPRWSSISAATRYPAVQPLVSLGSPRIQHQPSVICTTLGPTRHVWLEC